MESIQLSATRDSTEAPATHSSLEGSTPVKETIMTTTSTKEPISTPSQLTDTPNESFPLSTHTPYPTIMQPDNNTNPFRTTPSHTSTPEFALGNVSSHQDSKEKPAPGTTQKTAQNVGMLAGNVAGAGVQGARNEYEHVPSAGEVEDLGVTDAGTVFDYSPSTDQMQDTGLSAASTAAGYAPSGVKVTEAESTDSSYIPSTRDLENAASTAAECVPSAQSVKETISSYIPKNVKNYLLFEGASESSNRYAKYEGSSKTTSVSGTSSFPTATLPSEETGQNPVPYSSTGPNFRKKHASHAGLPTYEDSKRTKGQVEANRSSGGGMSMGVGVISGYHNQGDAEIGTQRGVNKDLPNAPTTASLGADSSLAGRGQDSTTTSTSTFSKGQDQEHKTWIKSGAKGSSSTAFHTSALKDNEEKGAAQETKDTFAAMRLGAQHTTEKRDEKQVPGMGAEREQGPGMREMRCVSANQKLNAQARTHLFSSPGGAVERSTGG
ncbi:hypothetical protein BDQ17DRAFT_1323690 [Cyathus striatus]|nr:hypothetical protein BDQ17DRAFT_1323690 [Cyathus striatus]